MEEYSTQTMVAKVGEAVAKLTKDEDGPKLATLFANASKAVNAAYLKHDAVRDEAWLDILEAAAA